MLSETVISKGYQTVVPARIRKAHRIMPGDVLEWIDTEQGILVHPRKKRTTQRIKRIKTSPAIPKREKKEKRRRLT